MIFKQTLMRTKLPLLLMAKTYKDRKRFEEKGEPKPLKPIKNTKGRSKKPIKKSLEELLNDDEAPFLLGI